MPLAQVDARDASGCTALHRAAAQGEERVLQQLLQHGAVASLAFQAGVLLHLIKACTCHWLCDMAPVVV